MNSIIPYKILQPFKAGRSIPHNRPYDAAIRFFENGKKANRRQELPTTSIPLWAAILCCLSCLNVAGQVPAISSFSPTTGPVGAAVTINGSNFNTTPAANVVYFGAVKAVVTAASATSLTATVPLGATYQPLTVTSGNLTAYSTQSFAVTFPSNTAGITANSFAAKVDYVSGYDPIKIAVSDLDGDGKPDMVTANQNSNTISVLRNTGGSGVVSFAAKVDYATSAPPIDIAIGDLDGDGKPDLAVTNGSAFVSVFKNTGAAGTISFAPRVDYTARSSVAGIAIGDLDGDGKPDLAVANSVSFYSLFRNTSTVGAISFNTPVDVFGQGYTDFAVYDMNGDGKPDLIFDDGYTTISILRNTTTGGSFSFAARVNFTTAIYNSKFCIGDLDGDGKPELAVTTGSGVSVLRNTSTSGTVSFATKVDFAAGGNPRGIAMGDLDGDGKPDMAVINSGAATVSVLRNTGSSGTVSFAAKVDYPTGQYPYSVAVADLDGDSKPDLAIANHNYTSSSISVIRNQTDGPNIASFTPTNAAAGSNITINGTNFTGATAVTIGGLAATGFTVNSDVQITAVVPALTGGNIVVTTPAGTATLGGFYNGPAITSVSPVSGPLGTTVTINGTAFDPVAGNNIVFTGAVKAAVSTATTTSLAVIVPAGTTYQPITVTTNNRTAYSTQSFAITFPSNPTGLTANSFAARVDYNGSNFLIADMDGDGKPDMVGAGYIYRNTSTSGALSFASTTNFSYTTVNNLVLGDLDGDGKPDIVAGDYSTGIVSVFRNTSTSGALSFAAKTDVANVSSVAGISISDVDGDGKPDLAVAVSGYSIVSLFRNTSTGPALSFAAKTDVAVNSVTKVSFGDLDGDGKPEMVVANYYANTVSTFKNTSLPGGISFAPQVDYAVGTSPANAVIGDLDGDGKPDLAVSNGGASTVSVLRNLSTLGNLSFASALSYATGGAPGTISIADVDGDGKPDLAIANTGSYSASVLKNTGTAGTIGFAAKVDYTTGGNIGNIATGDLDGDGRPDLALSNSDQGTVSLLRNQTAGTDIFSFTPAAAPVGTSLTINGINFTGATAVSIGGVAATSFNVVSDAQITAVVASVTGGIVSVTSPKGVATLAGFYNGPAVASFSPASGPVGTSVTITGTNFGPSPSSNTVYFGAVKATVTAASTTSLTVTVPVGATYQPLTVTTSNATAYANKPFIVTLPVTAAGFTPTSFASKTDFTTAANPYAVAASDLDGDGKPDLITADYSTGYISVLKNGSTGGGVSFAAKTDFTSNYYLYNMAVGDLDGDGKPDLAVASGNSNAVYVYRNTTVGGTIAFANYVSYYTGSGNSPRSVAVGDLDGDGKPDLAVVNSSGALCFFRNTSTAGSLSFAERSIYPSTGATPYSIAIGDIDGDGKPDLVVTDYAFYLNVLTLSVIKNTSISGALSFGSRTDFVLSSVPYAPASNDPYSVAIGDLDGDGKPDLAVANYNPSTVSVFRNQSAGGLVSFANQVDYPTGTNPYNVSIGDLDGDGKPDLAVANSGSATVSIFKNGSTPGTVSFAAKTDYATGATPQSVSIGDLDGDGKPDLAIANAGTNTVSVLINQIGNPAITSFTPLNGGVGATVSITGNGFTGATAVSFGGIPASSFSVVSDAQITAVVAAVAGGIVSVTTPGGTATLGGFYNGHSITSFSPASGPLGTSVTITGTNFGPTAAENTVYFGAVKAAVTAASTTSLTVTVPAGASYQPITVTVNNLTVYTNKPFVVTFASTITVFASNSFAAKVDYATGTNPSNVAVGDLDGDGKPDIAVAYNNNINSSAVSVLKNGSTATAVSFAAKVDYTTGSLPFSLAIGDMNGDGKPDLAVANIGANTVSLLKNTSAGGLLSFAPKIDYTTETTPISVAIGDLDGDGKPDLALVTTGSTNNVSVYKNTGGAGAFSFAPRVNYTAGNFPYSIAMSDVDGDGKPDLVVANANSSSVSVFRNTSTIGAISFAPKTDYTAGNTPYSVAIGDLDGDGKPDLAVANGSSNTVSVLRNTGSPGTVSFAPKLDYATGTDSRCVAISDMDGDGKPDLAVANNSSNNVSILKNGSTIGTITFAAKVDYAAGVNPRSMAAGDLTGDGKPDLVAANYSANTVSVLRNQLVVPALCAGGSIAYTSTVTGTNYQWQVDAGSGFTAISDNGNYAGSNTATLQLSNLPSAWYGYRYRCAVDGGYSGIYTLQFTNTWTGAVNTVWENAANWSCGTVPDGNVDVVIGSGAVVVSSAAACRSLKMSPGRPLR